MILLTGGAGFIGSNILAALNAAGRSDVIVVDDLTVGAKCANLSGKEFADYFDGSDIERFAHSLPRLDGICHQAACVDTTAGDGRQVMQANFDMSKRLLAIAQENGCPFVYASSAAVYGDGGGGFREEPGCERAKTPYAFSKWAFDQYVRRRLADLPIPVVGLRYFNVYGPGEHHKGRMASVAWHSFMAIKRGESPQMFEGSEHFCRDFIYVADVAAVNLHFLTGAGCDVARKGVYNLGTGEPRSFADLVRIASTVAGGLPPTTIAFPTDLRGQYQAYTCADISRLRMAGWTPPFTTLEAGMAAYWQAMLS